MGKISPVSAKYIIHAAITIDGIVDRPDVIGAIFGQTEGLLGSDLELRELQRSGRIGRIEVNMETKTGKAVGSIVIPSSLDKAETSIVAAALEIIQRIGPCNAKIAVGKIEDVRVSKRAFVIERAKELLQCMIDTSMPDSQELADEVSQSVRVMEIREYGRDKLPAGPQIDDADEVIVVEGRADVLNLLKHGFKNAIAMNGTSVPETIIELSKKKTLTIFCDGDRGGDLIIRELLNVAEIDFVTKAPDGKEVEEITKKEIHKCLRSRITSEQAQMELSHVIDKLASSRPQFSRPQGQPQQRPQGNFQRPQQQQQQSRPPQNFQPQTQAPPQRRVVRPTDEEKVKFRAMAEDLVGTRGGYILDGTLSILGKVPVAELCPTIKSLHTGMYAIVFDGKVDEDIASAAEDAKVKFLIGMDSVGEHKGQVTVITVSEL